MARGIRSVSAGAYEFYLTGLQKHSEELLAGYYTSGGPKE